MKIKDKFNENKGILIYTITLFILAFIYIHYFGYVEISESLINLFWILIAAGVTFALTKEVLEYDKKHKWKKIRDKVFESLNKELSELIRQINILCDIEKAFSSEKELTKEELNELSNKKLTEGLKNKDKIKIVDMWRPTILQYNMFKNIEYFINNFQIKYLEYLHTDLIINLIDIEKSLHFIDLIIKSYLRHPDQLKNSVHFKNNTIKNIETHLKIISEKLSFLIENNLLEI